ncbi:hypothetical protein B296_00055712 [Ensete ventricosum]|uniref:Uncharacterized protein n=1 Tax=Ensete ventricosum TaxID=4639 RepID=A0A426XI87_ENSVE|nr:hypothetical protein B296_00055712 [Ensete ventricosum]
MSPVACCQGRCWLVGPSRRLCHVASRLLSGALLVGRPVMLVLPCRQSLTVVALLAADHTRLVPRQQRKHRFPPAARVPQAEARSITEGDKIYLAKYRVTSSAATPG